MSAESILVQEAENYNFEFESDEDDLLKSNSIQLNNKNKNNDLISDASKLSILQNSMKQLEKEENKAISDVLKQEAILIKDDMSYANDEKYEESNGDTKPTESKIERINNEIGRDFNNDNNSEAKNNDDQDDESDFSNDSADDDNGDIDEETRNLNILFLASIYRGDRREADDLIKKGALVNCNDRHGWTALHFAASKGFSDIIEFLISVIKNSHMNLRKFINKKDNITGWTPLHVACVNCNVDCVNILLNNGAKKKLKNNFGELPVDCIGKLKNSDRVFTLVKLKNMTSEAKLLL